MYESNYRPKILFAIATKRHDRRFYVSSENKIFNILPGTVINEKFIRPEAENFYMQGHCTSKVKNLIICFFYCFMDF